MKKTNLSDYHYISLEKTFYVPAIISAYCWKAYPYPANFLWEEYPFGQILFNIDSVGTYETESGQVPFMPGMMVYRPPQQKSRVKFTTQTPSFALISFLCESPALEIFPKEPFALYGQEHTSLLDLIQTTTRICKTTIHKENLLGMEADPATPPAVLDFIGTSLERFLSMVYCRLTGVSTVLDESQKSNKFLDETIFVCQIKEYLQRHLFDNLSISELCTYFGTSETTLMKYFKKNTNQTIMEYYTDLKIEEAKSLICSTPKNFTQISQELGFNSPNYFSKVFKSKTGYTPSEYSRMVSKRALLADFG